ncbi:MAG: hypothetical protein GX066_01915 [Clostridiaceae bacterium]|nr:hypothetical protein [Clostridiaceae bacterium]
MGKIKKMFALDEIKSGLNEVEQYLNITAENINISLNEIKQRKPKKKRKVRVDTGWRLKTASREIKFKMRKLFKHM